MYIYKENQKFVEQENDITTLLKCCYKAKCFTTNLSDHMLS